MKPKQIQTLFAIALLALLVVVAAGCRSFSLDLSGEAARIEAEGREAIANAKADAINTEAQAKADAIAAAEARRQAEWQEAAGNRTTQNRSVSTWWKWFPLWAIGFTILTGGGTVLAYVYYVNRRAALQSSVVVLPKDRPVVIPLGDRILALSPPTEVGLSGVLLDTLSGDVTEFGPHGDIAGVLNTRALRPPEPNAFAQIVGAAMAKRGLAPPIDVPLIEDKGRGE